MRKKELERLNNELILKVEKQNALIEKLQKELSNEKVNTKTIFVDKIPICLASDNLEPSIRTLNSKPSILDNYGTDLLLKQAMTLNGSFVFSCIDRKPLDFISFDEWVESLTRESLIGNLKHNNPEVFAYLDQLDLASIKTFFKSALKNHYNKEKEKQVRMINDIVIKELEKVRGGK